MHRVLILMIVVGLKRMVNIVKVILICMITLEPCSTMVSNTDQSAVWWSTELTLGLTTTEGRFALAEEHLLVGTDHSAELLGTVAAKWSETEGMPSGGLFIARVVFQ